MDRTVSTIIDPEKCTGCGLCIEVCPSRTLTMKEGKAIVSGERSLSCGHCVAVCPVDAVRVTAIDPGIPAFKTFQADGRWLPHGEYDTAQLVRLMASRRSCRNYTDQPVDRNLLDDLVQIGTTAPSGTNSQRWTFTILPSRKEVLALGDRVAGFFKRLNRMVEKGVVRRLLKLVGKGEMDMYYREYYESVKEAIGEWEQLGKDRLFHGATAAIVVSSRPGASCPAEDALLATQNILLAAHSMGLGTCLIGFAVSVMRHERRVKRLMGIPDDERVYSVIALGHPNEKYRSIAGRRKALSRYVDLGKE